MLVFLVIGYLLISAFLNSIAEQVIVKAELIEKDTETSGHSTGDSVSSSTTYSLYFKWKKESELCLMFLEKIIVGMLLETLAS